MSRDEKWCVIDGYPDYEVSDAGRVRRLTSRTCAKAGTILKPGLRAGYPSVDLSRPGGGKRSQLVHRLVAAAFLGPAPENAEVNHLNGVKTDAAVENLEYLTREKNQQHAYDSGLQRADGERNGFAKLTREQVSDIRVLADAPDRPSYRAIGERFGVTGSNVRAIVQGRSWR